MPQTFYAVKCASCGTFQSILFNKRGKFSCKICNEKQSIQKKYAISNKNKDIRQVVMDLNMARAEIDKARAEAEYERGQQVYYNDYDRENQNEDAHGNTLMENEDAYGNTSMENEGARGSAEFIGQQQQQRRPKQKNKWLALQEHHEKEEKAKNCAIMHNASHVSSSSVSGGASMHNASRESSNSVLSTSASIPSTPSAARGVKRALPVLTAAHGAGNKNKPTEQPTKKKKTLKMAATIFTL
jgi:uncharacterized Zn finger protein (UPF0148 family)